MQDEPIYIKYPGAYVKVLLYTLLHPQGVTAQELQRECKVHKTYCSNILTRLQQDDVFVKVGVRQSENSNREVSTYVAIVEKLYPVGDSKYKAAQRSIWQDRLKVLTDMGTVCKEKLQELV
jgi:hypothetical protein